MLLTLAGIKLLLNGSTIIAPPKGADGKTPCVFAALAPNISIDGGGAVIEKSGIVFESRADKFQVANFNLGLNSPPGSIDQVGITEGGGTNFWITRILCGQTATVAYYGSFDGFSLYGCTGDSIGEATVRWDMGPGNHVPINMLIQGGDYTNKGNADGKQTFENRTGSGKWSGVTIRGDVVTGQGTPSNPPQTPGQLGTLIIEACNFIERTPGNPFIGIRHGSSVTIDKLTKFVDPEPTAKTVVCNGGKLTWV
jgi:hypothetical protein